MGFLLKLFVILCCYCLVIGIICFIIRLCYILFLKKLVQELNLQGKKQTQLLWNRSQWYTSPHLKCRAQVKENKVGEGNTMVQRKITLF